MPTSFPTVDEIEQYRPAVTRYIRHLVRDDAEAEDLAQETFLRAHRQISMLHDPAALGGWLYQIASHASIDRLRQKAQAIQRQIDAPVEDLPIADGDRPSPLTIIQQNEMSDCVQRYVANLHHNIRPAKRGRHSEVRMTTEHNQVLTDENARKLALSKRLEDFGWAVLLVAIGTIWLVPDKMIPQGSWLIAVGVILLGLNAVRSFNGIRMRLWERCSILKPKSFDDEIPFGLSQ